MSAASGSVGVECPTCGRTDFASERGMKQHHKIAHGESIAGFQVECHWCGETRRMSQQNIDKAERHFCDSKCRGAWMSENQTGEDNPMYNQIAVECSACGDPVAVRQARYERSERHFCDPTCMGRWLSETGALSGENSPRWNRVEVNCDNCGAVLSRIESRALAHNRQFCDESCRGDWMSEHRSGENHPLWSGGWSGYQGPNWNRQRQRRLEIDGYTCQGCGMGQSTHFEEYGDGLTVHHLIPRRCFEDNETGEFDYRAANSIDNLVTLCRGCHHGKWEGIPLRPQLV